MSKLDFYSVPKPERVWPWAGRLENISGETVGFVRLDGAIERIRPEHNAIQYQQLQPMVPGSEKTDRELVHRAKDD